MRSEMFEHYDDMDMAIYDLCTAALRAGNYETVAICERALSGMIPYRVMAALSGEQRAHVERLNQRAAYRRCVAALAKRRGEKTEPLTIISSLPMS